MQVYRPEVNMKSQRLRTITLDDGTIVSDIIGADPEGEDELDEDEDLDEDENEDDEDEDEEPTVESLQARIEELEAENRRVTRRMKAADRAKTAAETKLRTSNDKKKPAAKTEDDEDDRDATIARLQDELAAASGGKKASIVRDEFRDLDYEWHDRNLAFSLLDLEEVDVEDGKVDADSLTDAVKALVKAKPFLLKSADSDDDEDEDEEDKPRRKSGLHSNRRRSKTPDKQALRRKYPALATRG